MGYRAKFGFYIAQLTSPTRRRVFLRASQGRLIWLPFALRDGEWECLASGVDPCWYPTVEHAEADLAHFRGRYPSSMQIEIVDCNTGEVATEVTV